MRGEAGGEGAADTALKTKTPRQCGEKKCWTCILSFLHFAYSARTFQSFLGTQNGGFLKWGYPQIIHFQSQIKHFGQLQWKSRKLFWKPPNNLNIWESSICFGEFPDKPTMEIPKCSPMFSPWGQRISSSWEMWEPPKDDVLMRNVVATPLVARLYQMSAHMKWYNDVNLLTMLNTI